jgi:hypothetical protein
MIDPTGIKLTDTQRGMAVDRLSEDDCGHLVAYFADQFPAQFDAALAALGSYRESTGKAA